MGKVDTEFMKRKKNQLPLVGGIITKLASDPMVLGMAQMEIASRAGRYVKGKKKSHSNSADPLDRFNDLQKQGFMKSKKAKTITYYEAWTPFGVTYKGENKAFAEAQVRLYGGKIKVVKERRNPGKTDIDLSKADEIAKGWHGREPEGSIEIEESESYEQTGVVLGDLMELGILSPAGGQGTFDNKKIVFKHNKPLLVGDLDRENLDIVGGDQEIQGLPCSKQYLPIGFVVSIVYETDKHHLEGSTGSKDPYEHYFGEEFYRDNGYEWNDGESGEDFLIKVTEAELLFEAIERELLPLLVYDTVNTRMKLIGGQYTIEDVGITN